MLGWVRLKFDLVGFRLVGLGRLGQVGCVLGWVRLRVRYIGFLLC